MTMKKLFLTSIAALFLATGTATLHTPAKAQVVSRERYDCIIGHAQALGRAGDPRYHRLVGEIQRRGGGAQAGALLRNTADARSLKRDAMRHCP